MLSDALPQTDTRPQTGTRQAVRELVTVLNTEAALCLYHHHMEEVLGLLQGTRGQGQSKL